MLSAFLVHKPRAVCWVALAGISIVFTSLLMGLQLPAALLLGPMIAGIIVENGGANICVPKLPLHIAQAVIGCMIAQVITPDILHSFARQWPLFSGISVLVIIAGCLLGLLVSRWQILPGTTAIWGLLPGAASAMMIMADSHGADSRLVAFMQYLRVVIVAMLASIIARCMGHESHGAVAQLWFAPFSMLPFAETLLLIAGGVALARLSRMPAGMIMLPMFMGIALQAWGVMDIVLPRWLLALSYLMLGWSVGLRFTRAILIHAARALPQMVLCIAVLILFSGIIAIALVEFYHIDPLTAYLATSPGGADSVAIIAASTKVDVGFVMALQISRALLVLLIGPSLSRLAARFTLRPSSAESVR